MLQIFINKQALQYTPKIGEDISTHHLKSIILDDGSVIWYIDDKGMVWSNKVNNLDNLEIVKVEGNIKYQSKKDIYDILKFEYLEEMKRELIQKRIKTQKKAKSSHYSYENSTNSTQDYNIHSEESHYSRSKHR